VLLTHRLSPAEYSVFAASQTLLILNGLVGGAGIPWVLAREISQATDEARRRSAVTFAFWGNAVAGLAVGALAAAVGAAFGDWQVVLLLFATSWVLSVGSTGAAVLQGQSRTGRLAVLFTVETVVKLVVALVAVSIWHTAAAALLGSLAGVFVLWASFGELRGRVGRPRGWDAENRALLGSAWRLGRLQVGVGLAGSIDTVAVAILPVGHVAAATYQAAAALGRVPTFVSNAIALSAFPALVTPARAARARAEALSTYGTVGLFAVLALVTAPRSVLTLLFPASFAGLHDLLLYTAPLGVGLGALNLVATFAQSRPRTSPTGWTLLAAVGAIVVGVVVGQRIGGVRGLSLAAGVVCWLAVFAVLAERTERAAVRGLASRPTLQRLAVLAAGGLALALARGRIDWLAVVIVAGVGALAAAFPELSGSRRPAGGP
jgi:O-antigen/teichoic acid export membrane protein